VYAAFSRGGRYSRRHLSIVISRVLQPTYLSDMADFFTIERNFLELVLA
jgi:hypothetical protein